MRLGAEDQVGDPTEDTPGWDQFLGYGRINAAASVALVNGPWLALDFPHYTCAETLHVDLKDPTAGSSVDVTLTGSLGDQVRRQTRRYPASARITINPISLRRESKLPGRENLKLGCAD